MDHGERLDVIPTDVFNDMLERISTTHGRRMRYLLAASTVILLSCTTPRTVADSLKPDEFAARLTEQGAQLLDVRTAGEFSGGHLANARNLDWTGGQVEAALPELDKSKPVLLYCASGRRSAAASEFLRGKGFQDVVDLQGGINAWFAAGKAIER